MLRDPVKRESEAREPEGSTGRQTGSWVFVSDDLADRMPAIISKIPIKIAQNAITYNKTMAMMAGQANVTRPAIIPTTPSISYAQ
jgi:hypothetical protein